MWVLKGASPTIVLGTTLTCRHPIFVKPVLLGGLSLHGLNKRLATFNLPSTLHSPLTKTQSQKSLLLPLDAAQVAYQYQPCMPLAYRVPVSAVSNRAHGPGERQNGAGLRQGASLDKPNAPHKNPLLHVHKQKVLIKSWIKKQTVFGIDQGLDSLKSRHDWTILSRLTVHIFNLFEFVPNCSY